MEEIYINMICDRPKSYFSVILLPVDLSFSKSLTHVNFSINFNFHPPKKMHCHKFLDSYSFLEFIVC